MSDDSKTLRPGEHDEPQDEVEAHHKRVMANDEPAAEEGSDDEVEAHVHKKL
jgi:hypothetical protein